MNSKRTIKIHGKSEFITAATKTMQRAMWLYQAGYEKEADEVAQEAEKFFATAQRVNYGSYTKVV